jgi:hypothetical protein
MIRDRFCRYLSVYPWDPAELGGVPPAQGGQFPGVF